MSHAFVPSIITIEKVLKKKSQEGSTIKNLWSIYKQYINIYINYPLFKIH